MALWIIAPVLFLAGVRGEQQHQCHVCVPRVGAAPEVETMFPNSTLSPCPQATQVRTCPQHHRGCLTKTKGAEVTRSCVTLALDTCSSANGVEYCYCTGQLCNAPAAAVDVVTDDEDLGEGSGLRPEPPWLPAPTTSTVSPGHDLHPPPPPADSASSVHLLPALTAGAAIIAVWR